MSAAESLAHDHLDDAAGRLALSALRFGGEPGNLTTERRPLRGSFGPVNLGASNKWQQGST
jgi:hypothetical protein